VAWVIAILGLSMAGIADGSLGRDSDNRRRVQSPTTTMKEFLRENWLYIVAPLVIVLIGIVAMMLWWGTGNSPFSYNIF
jgi:hypothetical protein